jgi:DNA mismatch repair protein MutL
VGSVTKSEPLTAVAYGQVLSNEEMERVVNELFSCSNANYTPDGKAILCILAQNEIEQLLG